MTRPLPRKLLVLVAAVVLVPLAAVGEPECTKSAPDKLGQMC